MISDSFSFSSTISSRLSGILVFILIIIIAEMIFSTFSLRMLDLEVSEFLSDREDRIKKVLGLAEDIHHHTLSTLNKTVELHTTLNKVKDLQQKVTTMRKSAYNLKIQVQETSRMEVIKKYGTGIHRVEIELAFPYKMNGPDKFVVELASVDQMPHSVQIFLDMVSAGLLVGCSFIINTSHILKAAPLPHDGTSAGEKARAFMKHGLESVAFKEYSESYPHKTYTVGFVGDGGPGFYINTEDNTDIHSKYPCFGTIVSGFDAVRRMEENPITNGIWLEQRIGIEHARILELRKNATMM